MKPARLLAVLIVALVLAFTAGVVRLFNLRFAAGDVYPPYSSLRADPLGARALYESLENLPRFSVERNYRPLAKLKQSDPATVLILGVQPLDLMIASDIEAKEIETLAAAGHRVVISALPTLENPRMVLTNETQNVDCKGNDCPPQRASLEERWGYRLAYSLKATNQLWRTALYFDRLDARWEVIAGRSNFPAIVACSIGKGRLLLCADSYFLSNEALRRDRQPELIADVLGDKLAVVFDETHLGVARAEGVMTLARKYGLHGWFAGLAVLLALYAWQNTCSFLPPVERPANSQPTGKDSAAGFVNLLRRSLPASSVLPVCVDEWKKSFRKTNRRLGRIEDVAGSAKNPVEGYRAISQILKERKP